MKAKANVIVGPNRGRAPRRYAIETLNDGRVRISQLVGGTLHPTRAHADRHLADHNARTGDTYEILDAQ